MSVPVFLIERLGRLLVVVSVVVVVVVVFPSKATVPGPMDFLGGRDAADVDAGTET